jgi:hypothetical protein
VFIAPHGVTSSIVGHPGPSRESLFTSHAPPQLCRARSKNKLQKSGASLVLKKHHAKHHDLPPIRHRFTTKKPRSTHQFSQKPLQKRPSTTPEKNYSRGSIIRSNTCAI